MRALLTSKACFKSGVASGSTVTVCSELFDRTPFAPFPLCRPFAFSVFSLLSLLGVAGAVGGGRAGIHGFMYPWAMALHIWHNRTVSLFGRKMNRNSVELWDNKIWLDLSQLHAERSMHLQHGCKKSTWSQSFDERKTALRLRKLRVMVTNFADEGNEGVC